MADKRATIVMTGEVQKVGYRDFVQSAARKLGIVGYVENMRDGSVRVVCEAEESVIKKFQKAINVKVDFIDVDEVKVVEIAEPTGEFEYFDIKYGSSEEELGERMGAGILYMAATRDEVRASRQDIQAMHTDLKDGFNRVEGSIDSMHSDVNTRFDTLDDKYGAISQQMNTLTMELQTSTKSLVALTEKIGALIDEKLAE